MSFAIQVGIVGDFNPDFQSHHFPLATLFQPQLSSTPDTAHPVVVAFLRAAARFKGYAV